MKLLKIFTLSRFAAEPQETVDFLLDAALGDDASLDDKMRWCLVVSHRQQAKYSQWSVNRQKDARRVFEVLSSKVGDPLTPNSTVKLGPCLHYAICTLALLGVDRDATENQFVTTASFALVQLLRHVGDMNSSYLQGGESDDASCFRFEGRNPSAFRQWLEEPAAPVDWLEDIAKRLVSLRKIWSEKTRMGIIGALQDLVNGGTYTAAAALIILRMAEPILPGMYFEELPTATKAALIDFSTCSPDLYSALPAWVISEANIPSTQTELFSFVSEAMPGEKKGTKRLPNFERLHETAWATLQHAYGDARKVPETIKLLASGDPVERRNALRGIRIGPNHQGQVYSCTASVAKWLLHILEYALCCVLICRKCVALVSFSRRYELVQEKPQIIDTLIDMAVSGPESYISASFDPDDIDYSDDKFRPECYEVCSTGCDLIFRFLRDPKSPDALVSACLKFCLFFPARREEILRNCFEMLDAPSKRPLCPEVHAGLLFLLTCHTRIDSPNFTTVLEVVHTTQAATLRTEILHQIATFCLLRLKRDQLEPIAEDLLSAILGLLAQKERPSFDNKLWFWYFDVLDEIGQLSRTQVFPTLLSRLEKAITAEEAQHLAEILLQVAFGRAYGSSSSGRIPDAYDFSPLMLDTLKFKALQVVESMDLCWIAAVDRAALLLQMKRNRLHSWHEQTIETRLQHKMKEFLNLGNPLTRLQLSRSLTLMQERPKSKDEMPPSNAYHRSPVEIFDEPESQ